MANGAFPVVNTRQPKSTMLEEPEPNAAQEAEFFEDLADTSAPNIQAAPEEAIPQAQAEDFSDLAGAPAAPEVEESPGFLEANFTLEGLKQQIDEAGLRVVNSLAKDPKSQRLTLEQRLGPENVKQKKNGEFLVRLPGKQKFQELDPGTLEFIGDIYADMYRENIQGVFTGVGATAGAGIGTAALGPGVGTVVGGLAGGFVGGVGGTTFAELEATKQGVVREPGRLVPGETAKDITAEGAEFAALEGITRGMLSKVKGFFKRRAQLKKLTEVSPVDRLTEANKQNIQTLDELKRMGFTKNIPGTDVPVTAQQLVDLPETRNVAKTLKLTEKGGRALERAELAAQKQFSETFEEVVETAADLGKHKLDRAFKKGLSGVNPGIANRVSDVFESVRLAEGKVVGESLEKATKTARTTRLPLAKTQEYIGGVLDELGIKTDGSSIQFPNIDRWRANLGGDVSKSQAKVIQEEFRLIIDGLNKGGLSIDQVQERIKLLEPVFKGGKKSTQVRRFIGGLLSNLRADRREIVPLILSPEDGNAFKIANKRFADVANQMNQLGELLDDKLANSTFVKGLINKGRKGRTNLNAAKEFLLQERPDLWTEIKAQYIEELAIKSRVANKPFTFDAKRFQSSLQSLGPEYQKDLFDGKGGVELVNKTLDLADQLQTSLVRGSDEDVIKKGARTVGTMSAWVRTVNAAYLMLNSGARNHRLLKLLSREGTESFLGQVPQQHKGRMRQLLDSMVANARQAGILDKASNAASEAADLGSVLLRGTGLGAASIPVDFRDE